MDSRIPRCSRTSAQSKSQDLRQCRSSPKRCLHDWWHSGFLARLCGQLCPFRKQTGRQGSSGSRRRLPPAPTLLYCSCSCGSCSPPPSHPSRKSPHHSYSRELNSPDGRVRWFGQLGQSGCLIRTWGSLGSGRWRLCWRSAGSRLLRCRCSWSRTQVLRRRRKPPFLSLHDSHWRAAHSRG